MTAQLSVTTALFDLLSTMTKCYVTYDNNRRGEAHQGVAVVKPRERTAARQNCLTWRKSGR